MKTRPGLAYAAASWLILLAVMVVTIYRAVTQDITHDEALTYLWYIAPERPVIRFDANNHMLNTFLMARSVAALGLSEFSVRLPALLGAALYLSAVGLICNRLLGRRPRTVLAAAAMTLNPVVMDFLVAARGYGLALGLSTWALYLAILLVDAPLGAGARRLIQLSASVVMGLCLLANAAFLFPCVAVALIVVASGVRKAISQRKLGGLFELAWSFILPGPVLAGVFIVPWARQSRPSDFCLGFPTFDAFVRDLLTASFLRQVDSATIPPMLGLALAVLGAAALAWGLLRRQRRPADSGTDRRQSMPRAVRQPADQAALVMPLLVSVILVAGHYLAGLLYPVDRSGLYFVPLATLAAFVLAGSIRASRRWALVGVAAAGLLIAAYGRQLTVSCFDTWRYGAGSRTVFRAMVADRHKNYPREAVYVAGDWLHYPAMDFYRDMYHTEQWMSPFYDQTDMGAVNRYRYMVFKPGAAQGLDLPRGPGIRWEVLYKDPVSGTQLFVRRHP